MENRHELLKEYYDSIEDVGVKKFMECCVDVIPDYWFHVSASSTNKYHPDYAIGDGGLMRHTIALLRFFNRLVRNDLFGSQFTNKELDLLRVACLMHDTYKSGTQSEYEDCKYTKFNHPILAANVVRGIVSNDISEEEKELIANAIESHMGQWNTDPRHVEKESLPLPKNKYQKLVHLADYLAATKGVEVQFDGFTPESRKIAQEEQFTVDTYVFNFGKYNGMKLTEVNEKFPDYIAWCKKNLEREPLKSLLEQI